MTWSLKRKDCKYLGIAINKYGGMDKEILKIETPRI